MKIEYDKEANAIYIQIRETFVDDNIDIEEGVTVDFDAQKQVVGIEILDVSKKLSQQERSRLTIENFPLVETAT